jgi:uncharacterized protein (TIGR02145 family)
MKFIKRILIVFILVMGHWLSVNCSDTIAADKVVVIPLASNASYEVPTVTSAGQVWMDRNLGALRVAGSSSDSLAYGWLYQWGRPADGHENRSSPMSATLSDGDVPGHGRFIGFYGILNWRRTPNNSLWQGVHGVNNPCPPGFRLPTESEWETERVSWSSNNPAGAFSSPLKLTAAGLRSEDGEINLEGSYGYYWSSTVHNSYIRSLTLKGFSSSQAQMEDSFQNAGFTVRCIQD